MAKCPEKGFVKIKGDDVILTPDLAKDLEKWNVYGPQRKYSEKWARELAERVKMGLGITFHIVIAKNIRDGKRYLMNGQHSCRVPQILNAPIDAYIEYFEVDGEDGLGRLYSQYDVVKGRSIMDIVKVQAHALSLDWTLKSGSLVAGAAAFLESSEGRRAAGGKWAQAELLKKYLEEGATVNAILSADYTNSRHMRRVPVVAAMLATLKKRPEMAFAFWTKVRDGENLRKGEPAWKLWKYLEQTVMHGNNRAARREIYVKCIHGFNAFKRGENTNLQYRRSDNLPKVA